jgi:hypothetical protein
MPLNNSEGSSASSNDISGAVNAVLDKVSYGLAGPLRTAADLLGAQGSLSGAFGPGKHVLFNMYARRDPLMAHQWFCNLPVVNNVALDWYYVEEFTAPLRSYDIQSQYREGKMYHFAGQHSISSLSMRFYDDSSGRIQAYLESWRKAVMGDNGKYGYPQNYKHNIEVVVLDVTRVINVYSMLYKGCWPQTADAISLGSQGADRITSSQEFSCDDMTLTVRSFPSLNIGETISSGVNSIINKFSGLNPLV